MSPIICILSATFNYSDHFFDYLKSSLPRKFDRFPSRFLTFKNPCISTRFLIKFGRKFDGDPVYVKFDGKCIQNDLKMAPKSMKKWVLENALSFIGFLCDPRAKNGRPQSKDLPRTMCFTDEITRSHFVSKPVFVTILGSILLQKCSPNGPLWDIQKAQNPL